MSAAIVLVLAAIVSGIAYLRGLRSTPKAKRSNTGRYGLAVLALLLAGLWLSGQAGNEAAAYGFGIAIALALLTCPLQPYQSIGERSKGLQVN